MSGMEDRNRQNVTIEQLLVWGYRDQRVHQATRNRDLGIKSSKGPLAAYSTLWDEGVTPVDASRPSGFESAEDAWRLHDLVMALGRYHVDCGQDLAAARYHGLGQYRGAEPPVGRGSVDQSARPWPTNGLLDIDLRALVMVHASKATRPALPGRDAVRFKPGNTVWHPKRKTKIYVKGWFCHVTADGDLLGDQIKAWEVYMAWRGCLLRLQRDLPAGSLTMFHVTDALPSPLEKPGSRLAG